MTAAPFRTARVVLFDAYGTLFLLRTIEEACATELPALTAPDAAAFAALWRSKQLEYSVHRSLMGAERYADFAQVTAEALDYTLARYGQTVSEETRSALLAAWRTPAPDPAAATVLAMLAPRPCAILSNGTPAMLAAAVHAGGLADSLDAILSADAVRVFKPDPRVYALGTARYELCPDEVCFVSANSWDAAGAGAFGYRVCWLNRHGWPVDRHGPAPEATIATLAALPALFGAGEMGTSRV